VPALQTARGAIDRLDKLRLYRIALSLYRTGYNLQYILQADHTCADTTSPIHPVAHKLSCHRVYNNGACRLRPAAFRFISSSSRRKWPDNIKKYDCNFFGLS